MKQEAMRNVTTSIPKSLKAELEELAADKRWSLSQVIRVAVEQYVARRKRKAA